MTEVKVEIPIGFGVDEHALATIPDIVLHLPVAWEISISIMVHLRLGVVDSEGGNLQLVVDDDELRTEPWLPKLSASDLLS